MKTDFKMTHYPGMTLSNEVRESISLDEDDLSDVEDEVFIRDGKNSFKTAEEIYAKRPLMAPRRKAGRNVTKIKNRPPCRVFCKPFCYFLASFSVLIGLIVLVVVLVSIFPLPLDRIHDWILSKFVTNDPLESYVKLLPCSDYKISDVWTVDLPKLTTDSPIFLIDVNEDGIEDVLFGFGVGENYLIFPNDIFCSIFMGVSPPCEGGIIALNGATGDIIWRYWINDTIYYIHCSEDANKDGVNDCIAIGTRGTIALVNAKNGTALWSLPHTTQEDVTIGSFVVDQNNDTVVDILASHTNLLDDTGHILLISGKTGEVINRKPVGAKTFYMPQILRKNNSDFIIFGTGGPTIAGNLSLAEFKSFLASKEYDEGAIQVLHQDFYNGVIIQSVLVDLTGDGISDIITAFYNSSVIAFNGHNLCQIWNITFPKSVTNFVPIPGYFNFDNVTDFLVVYETHDNILNYNYTQTFIIDGKNGELIYDKPISDSLGAQIGGISINMESPGYDLYLLWTSECKNIEMFEKLNPPLKGINLYPFYENCHQDNSTAVFKLSMLNQFDQPPGVEIYNSLNRTVLEFNGTKSPMQMVKEYFNNHPKLLPRFKGQAEIDEGYDNNNSGRIGIHKYGNSNFRHKDNRQGLIKDFSTTDYQDERQKYNHYYEPEDLDDYIVDEELSQNRNYVKNRDPRSKTVENTKLLNYKNREIYDYKNVRLAKNRLLHDLNNSPDEILSDVFYKNLENKLRTSKFEQRDLISHSNKKAEEKSINDMIKEHKKLHENTSFNLWNLESEKEENDRQNNYWRGNRKKRQTIYESLRKFATVGAVTGSLYTSNASSSIDIIFLTYWQPSKYEPKENLEEELVECIEEKMEAEGKNHHYDKNTEDEKRSLFFNECVSEQNNLKSEFPYFNNIYKLNMGRMTVYRLRIECQCNLSKQNERCAKFSPIAQQRWSSYLGKKGNGVLLTENNN